MRIDNVNDPNSSEQGKVLLKRLTLKLQVNLNCSEIH